MKGSDPSTVGEQRQQRLTRRKNTARLLRESTANFDKISFLVDQPESVIYNIYGLFSDN